MGEKLNEYMHETYGADFDKEAGKENDDPRKGRGSGVKWKKYYKKREEMWERIWGNKNQ